VIVVIPDPERELSLPAVPLKPGEPVGAPAPPSPIVTV
jgi:hypothetical protein